MLGKRLLGGIMAVAIAISLPIVAVILKARLGKTDVALTWDPGLRGTVAMFLYLTLAFSAGWWMVGLLMRRQ